jgi:hypothetical protein
MATKSGKLGQFAGQAAKPTSRSKPSAPPSTKGAGKSIGITLRFDPDDWKRLRDYATSKRTSLQAIAIQGCSLILENDGLKPLKGSRS